jgi:5-methylcytosine-specific restriction endonuclease McrA
VRVYLCAGIPGEPCGRQTTNSSRRCDDHNRGFRRQTRNGVYDDPRWRRLSKRLREEHVRAHGWWCPGWKRTAHASRDLTADHIVSVADGGALLDPANVRILCRSCNGRRGLGSINRLRAERAREARS